MSKNMHLEYKYTDRAGRDVFMLHAAHDNKRLLHPKAEVRVPVATDGRAEVRWLDPQPAEATPAPEQLELDLGRGAA